MAFYARYPTVAEFLRELRGEECGYGFLNLIKPNTMTQEQNIQQQIAVLEKDLAELKRIASQPQHPSFFSLKTIDDVRMKVRPLWITENYNGKPHHNGFERSLANNLIPSEADAKSVAAFRDLLCLCDADDSESEGKYFVYYNGNSFDIVSWVDFNFSPIKFRSFASARHALDNFPHLFKAYLKV